MPLSSIYSAAFSSIFAFAAFVFIVFLSLRPPTHAPPLFESHEFRAPKTNIWADLDSAEFEEVLKFLHAKPNSLNLTKGPQATTWDNQILLAEALLPNKTNAVTYLDGNSAPPPRWARVLVSQGAAEVAALYDYMVGPLPISDISRILPLDFCYNSGRNYGHNPYGDNQALIKWLNEKLEEVPDIILDLLGSALNHLDRSDPDGLDALARVAQTEPGRSIYWIQFYKPGRKSGAKSILPQGLYAKFDIPTRDPSNWKLTHWYYNGIIYNSTANFRAAWQSPSFEKVSPNLDGNWTDIEDYGYGLLGREKPPPVMIQPLGPRFNIDQKENFVSWMGFEFYIAFSQVTGISLLDIRFKGERIIYELGMQEALVQYAGDDPLQGGQCFLDTFMRMGADMFELVPGYDCPAYATYLSTSYHVSESTLTNENNICLFEYTADHALQRHTTDSWITISRNQYLVLRSVSTVGNYDYTIDYLFYLDGSIEVKVRASGFIFGAFYGSPASNNTNRAEITEYGYRVHDAVATSMHDHVINFKADLDIAGTANTLVRVGIEPVSVSYPWDETKTTSRNTMHLTNTPTRDETGLDWPRNAGEMYVVLNNDSINAWGEKRGYRIMPGTGIGTPPHLTILNSTCLLKSAEWASRDLWVVKQNDLEPKSANFLNFADPEDPLVDFGKFVDGEAIVQEDLVVYFNLGSHHISHSGDIPNTLMHTSASSIMFTPHNFHDRDPSRESAQGVRLEIGASGQKARYFGGKYTHGACLNTTDLEPDLLRYQATQHDVTDFSLNKSLMGI